MILVEVATYPEERVVQQIQDDIRLVRLARGVLPEALVLCLCPKGEYRVPSQVEATSALGWTAETLRWKVVEVWNLSAEELLAAPLVGVVPLVTLARYDGPTEVLLQRCRDRIEREGGQQKDNLLAVTHVFARLHYNKPEWLNILGGSKMIIETPFHSRDRRRVQASGACENHARRSGNPVRIGDAHHYRWIGAGEGPRKTHSADPARGQLCQLASVRGCSPAGTPSPATHLDARQAAFPQATRLRACESQPDRLHDNKPEWLDILGGSRAMIESPLIQQICAELRGPGW